MAQSRFLATQILKPIQIIISVNLGPFGVSVTNDYFVVVKMTSFGLTTYDLNLTLGLTSVLIPPAVIPSGNFITPDFGFNVTTSTPLTIVIGGLDLGSAVSALGIGVAGGIGLSGLTILGKQGKFTKITSKLPKIRLNRKK